MRHSGATFLFWLAYIFSLIGPAPWTFVAYAIAAMAWIHDLYVDPEEA